MDIHGLYVAKVMTVALKPHVAVVALALPTL